MKEIKAIKLSRFLIMVIGIAILLQVPGFSASGKVQLNDEPIIVELYGKPIKFDVQPQLINGRTMVPLRAIFEAIGLDVGWNPDLKQVTGTKDGTKILLTIGKNVAYINSKLEILDAPPVIVNGSTLVPIRFIAEATGLDVEWDETTKTVIIKEVPQAIVYKENNKEFISGYYKNEYLKLTSNGTTLVVDGKIKNVINWNLIVYDQYAREVFEHSSRIQTKGSIKDRIDLSLLKGKYNIAIYINDDRNSRTLWSYYTNIPINVEEDTITFDFPPTYEENYNKVLEASRLNPKKYLSLDHIKEDEREVLVNLAEKITKGLDSDYDKLLAIHNWVTDNIYYDYDAYRTGNYVKTDAYGTYENGKSVCQGYAELTLALCRAVGIPTRLVSGYALGIGTSGIWDENSLYNISNHAWNEAFIDNRWVILDTTWDTFNRYENGRFIEGQKSMRYFDISLQYFSSTHRIIDN